MSGEFDSRKDSQSTKFERRRRIFVKLSFRELCDSKLSGLHPFDNMAIIHWVKNWSKTERYAVISWDTHPSSNFYDPHWELFYCDKWNPRTSEISTPTEIVVGTHFHGQHGTKTTLVFFTCWWRSLLPATCKFSLLTIRQHSATRKHLFLYPPGERSDLRKTKNDKHQL